MRRLITKEHLMKNEPDVVISIKGNGIHPPLTRNATSDKYEDVEVTQAQLAAWETPEFQREVRATRKVVALGQQIKDDGGVIPGEMVLCRLGRRTFLVDGHHRRRAAQLSECEKIYTTVHWVEVSSIEEMRDVYDRINTKLASARPNDRLKSREISNDSLARIREECSFLGYATSENKISMMTFLKAWFSGIHDTPNASDLTTDVIDESVSVRGEVTKIVDFGQACRAAFETGKRNNRLWGLLNMSVLAWMYRRVVLSPEGRVTELTDTQFRQCLMSVGASDKYFDWLRDRSLRDRDRAPCYNHLKAIFVARLKAEGVRSPVLPQPDWAK